MTEIATVYAVFGSQKEAETIAAQMVEDGLAACANILAPCTSLFRWQGKIARESEVPALFKTSAARSAELIEAIARLHSYEIPAVCQWPISNGYSAYVDWVEEETRAE